MSQKALERYSIRDDLRGDISASRDSLRSEMHVIRDELRGEISASRDSLRGEMHGIGDELRVDMASMHKDLAKAIIANGVELRALHEAAIERIKLLGEAIRPAANASPPDSSR